MTDPPAGDRSPGGPATKGPVRDPRRRRGLLLALPSGIYLTGLFVVPFAIVVVYSFASRSATGRTVLGGWNLGSYRRLLDPDILAIGARSVGLALATTVVCLVLAYPLAYFMVTRGPAARSVLFVLVMIPFWSNFLVRTYAWKVLLGSNGPLALLLGALGLGEVRILYTNAAVLIGLVYGFIPFMILPVYAALERMDWRLVEAARDLYASGWTAFRRVTFPVSRAGVVAGSVLVFIPSLGAYVTPSILGGAKTVLLGDYIVGQFQSARNWPFGSALSAAVMVVMLVGTLLAFRAGARDL